MFPSFRGMVMSNTAILTQSERNLITFQGYAEDVEATLDTLVYTPPRNMSRWTIEKAAELLTLTVSLWLWLT